MSDVAKQGEQDLRVVDSYFCITESLIGNGCEHGFKPAQSCPNASCEGRRAHEAWNRVQIALLVTGEKEDFDQ